MRKEGLLLTLGLAAASLISGAAWAVTHDACRFGDGTRVIFTQDIGPIKKGRAYSALFIVPSRQPAPFEGQSGESMVVLVQGKKLLVPMIVGDQSVPHELSGPNPTCSHGYSIEEGVIPDPNDVNAVNQNLIRLSSLALGIGDTQPGQVVENAQFGGRTPAGLPNVNTGSVKVTYAGQEMTDVMNAINQAAGTSQAGSPAGVNAGL
jgi:hypothetical protein